MVYAELGVKVLIAGILGLVLSGILECTDRKEQANRFTMISCKLVLAGLIIFVYGNIMFILN